MKITINIEGDFSREVYKRVSQKLTDELLRGDSPVSNNLIHSIEAFSSPEGHNDDYRIEVKTYSIVRRDEMTRNDMEKELEWITEKLASYGS